MVDYTKATGVSGTMMMRVTSSTVEFWLKSGWGSSFFGNVNFSYSGPHGSGSFGHGYSSGDTWQRMGTITATRSGTYSWTMPWSGSSQIGGPTTQSVYVQRATVPPAPTPVAFTNIKHESVRTIFNSQGNGGSGVLEWQIRFGPDGSSILSAQNSSYSSSGTRVMTGLKPGSYYAAWARGRNAIGWGPWSSGRSFYTLAGCHVRVGGLWKSAVPYVRVDGGWYPSIPYIRKDGVWSPTAT